MNYCKNCAVQLQDGVTFCPNCGAGQQDSRQDARTEPTGTGAPAYAQAMQEQQRQQGPYSPAADAEQNKTMGILAYIIVLVPLFAAAKESRFCRFHNNQGLILLLFGIALGIVNTLIYSLLLAISWRLALTLGSIFSLLYLIIPVFCIIGIINASKGEMKELPIIGKFRILK